MDIQIATPYSTLFEDEAAKKTILSLSDAVELRGPGQAETVSGPFLFHCEMSLVSAWSEEERAGLSAMAENTTFEAVSFHVLSRYARNQIQDGAFHGKGKPHTEAEMLENAARNAHFARSVFQDALLLVENNNDLGTDAYEKVTDPEFLLKIMEANGLYLLLDIAHAKISSQNRHISLDDYLEGLDLEKTIQVHLSRHGEKDGRAFDAHEALRDEDWEFFEDRLSQMPALKYATVEYYKDAAVLADQLGKLRSILDRSA